MPTIEDYPNKYIGARYVPIFSDRNWSSLNSYEPLTVVQLPNGDSYTSKQFVPNGIEITNTNYWAHTGNYNYQWEELINSKNVKVFDTVADMKLNDTLNIGDVCLTKGFHSIGDNGNAIYNIVGTDTPNEMDLIECGNYNAKLLLFSNIIIPEKFGAYGNDVNDDTLILQYMIDNYPNYTIYGIGNYVIYHSSRSHTNTSTPTPFQEYGLQIENNIKFYGGNYRTINDCGNLCSIFNIYGESIVYFDSLNMDGNISNITNVTTSLQDGGCHCVRARENSKVYINNCNIINGFSDGVTASNNFVKLTNSYLYNNGRNGITCNSYDTFILDSTFNNNGSRHAPKSQIHCEPDKEHEIKNNFVIDNVICENTQTTSFVLQYKNTMPLTINNFIINNCNFDKNMSFVCANDFQANINISNSKFTTCAFTSSTRTSDNNKELNITVTNCVCNNISARGGLYKLAENLLIQNCEIIPTNYFRINGQNYKNITFENCKIHRSEMPESDTLSNAWLEIGDAITCEKISFINCEAYNFARFIRSNLPSTYNSSIKNFYIENSYIHDIITSNITIGNLDYCFALNNKFTGTIGSYITGNNLKNLVATNNIVAALNKFNATNLIETNTFLLE